jgi:prepilin-type N-terminal cleavage/methylation domain-containing protein
MTCLSKFKKFITKNERGDTIIEVMFAMAIISVVLAAAYATSSKNLQSSQLSKERTIASNIAETQLEQLKILTDAPDQNFFCLNLENTTNQIISTDLNSPADECIEGFFEKSIERDSSSSTYISRVRWVPPGGSTENKAQVSFVYKDFDFSALGSSTVTAKVLSASGTAASIQVEILNQNSVGGRRGIVYGTARNLVIDQAGFTTIDGPLVNNRFSLAANGLNPATRYYLRAFTTLADGRVVFSNLIELNSGPAAVVLNGNSYTNCTASAGYACINAGQGVYSNVNYRADYSSFNIPANSGYNAVVIDYSDNANYPNPPSNWYNYNINLYINGVLSIQNYLVGASSGRVLLPFNNSAPLTSIGIEWTNNYWVSTNTVATAYDPDFWMLSIGVASVEPSEITSRKPAVSTGTSSSITRSSAVVSGNVVSVGDSPIIERGIVYGPFTNPSIGNNTAISTQTSDSYSATLTKLKPNTTYYARAYARNAAGYAYAPTDISFRTQAVGPGYTYLGAYGSSQYYLSSLATDWRTAKTNSEAIGGHLVTLTSSAENTAVSSFTGLGSGVNTIMTWLGYTDEVVEGQWRWVTGESSSFTSWAPNEPNNSSLSGSSTGQDYGVMNWASWNGLVHKWDDQHFNQSSLRFIVEYN